jgi:hypothetical protein
MESATRPDGAREPRAEKAAVAASDGLRAGDSSKCLGVTCDELRGALQLSVVCAVTAALLAMPAGAGEFLVEDLVWSGGIDATSTFRDVARMQRLEQFTVVYDWSTLTKRWQRALASTWGQTILLFFFPVCYVAYFGGFAKIRRAALGSALLALMIVWLGYTITGSNEFLSYSPALGFAVLIMALRLGCPRSSKVPRQAIKQALALLVGNVLLNNVIPETGVRRALVRFALCSRFYSLTPR